MDESLSMTMTELIELRWKEFQPFLDDCGGDDIRATIKAIKAGFIPPHWTGILHCNNCGYMACPEVKHGQKVLKCAWCKTIVGGLYEQMRQHNEEWEEKIRHLQRLGKKLNQRIAA